MALLASFEQVRARRLEVPLPGGHTRWKTDFIDMPDGPQAFLVEGTPHRVLKTHFHDVDQFQIVAAGSGTLGRHALQVGSVHFARALTPYGPIINGDHGLGFMTLRARRDPVPHAQYVTEHRAKLDATPNRSPWQASGNAVLDRGGSAVRWTNIAELQGSTAATRGLSARALTMPAGAQTVGPDPAGSGGQFIVILKGGLRGPDVSIDGLGIVWVGATEGPFAIQAGSEGLEAVVVSFPETAGNVTAQADSAQAYCSLCSYVYDASAGAPDQGIAPGTPWQDVPDSFVCPDCSATKEEFTVLD